MNNLAPKVSVCIPVCNGEKFLRDAIVSVLNQTFTGFELIIVDDCSTDGSEGIVRSFADDRLRFARNPERLGLVDNWNKCLELSRGDYVCIFHHDDVMMPANLQRKVAVMDAHPTVGLVFSQAQVIDEKGNPVRLFSGDQRLRNGVLGGLNFFQQFFLEPNVICCPSVMVRTVCYENVGRFDKRLSFACDCEMWMRSCLFYDLAYIDEPLLKYREHDANESRKFYDHLPLLKEKLLFRTILIDKFPERVPQARALRRKIERDYSEQALDLANHHYSNRRYETAKALLKFSAAAYRPIIAEDRFIRLSTKLLLGERTTKLVAQAKQALQP